MAEPLYVLVPQGICFSSTPDMAEPLYVLAPQGISYYMAHPL